MAGRKWERECKDLPAFITERLPVGLTFGNFYFNTRYQGILVGGYTNMVPNFLKGIEVRFGIDYLDKKVGYDAIARK